MTAKGFRLWLGCGLATGAAILLRPDGGVLLIAVELYLLVLIWSDKTRAGAPAPPVLSPPCVLRVGLILAITSLAPLVPWAWRNLHTLHRWQPLAPRYANGQDEFVPSGFNRWAKTWIADYVSVEEIYWPVPGNTIDADKLPARAFDSEAQCQQTVQLLTDYNEQLRVTPELDARFATLAEERIRHAPLRYYIWLPLRRIADMWLRPRTETLPSDSRWWEFNDDPKWSTLAVTLGIIGVAYVGMAAAGLIRSGTIPLLGLLLTFVILRSIFLGTLENPEPRYTLECYPVIVVLASLIFRRQPRIKSC
jgi:hypothetical protein